MARGREAITPDEGYGWCVAAQKTSNDGFDCCDAEWKNLFQIMISKIDKKYFY